MEAAPSGNRQVGRYYLVERLAVGGMAEVFLACERGSHRLDRLVVVKRILPHLAEDPSFIQMFMDEARTAARIQHPNVVQIYELGESRGLPFMAMEYVAGSTLKELLTEARHADEQVPFAVVIDLMNQACKGTHAAHELCGPQGEALGLVHRDLSPHNLMITTQGHIKLLDFGIAKVLGSKDLTRTGMLKGKVSYMSPEQCRQETLDRRSDIFALGIVMWELLAARKMFHGMSELATMQAIVSGRLPDLKQYRPDVPEPIYQALRRCLAVDKRQRFQTAEEMRRTLQLAGQRSGLHVNPDRTVQFAQSLIGAANQKRQDAVNAALERSLITLSRVGRLGDTPTPESRQDRTALTPTHFQTASLAISSAAIGGLAVGTLLLAVGLGAYNYDSLTTSRATALQPIVPQGEVLTLTLAPTIEPTALLEDLEPLRTYLQGELDRPIEFLVEESYESAAQSLIEGESAYALLPFGIWRDARSRHPGLTPVVTEEVDGSYETDGLIVMKRGTEATTVKDLAGGTICYSDPNSNSGYNFPRAYLREQGLDPDKDFKTHYSGNHRQVLRDILAGVCDLGGTFNGNFNTASQDGIPLANIRILVPVTGSSPHDAWVSPPDHDPEVTQQLTEALLQLDPKTHLKSSLLGERKRISGYVKVPEQWLK